MNGPDIGHVEQRLAAVIREQRREAIGYTLLNVLCTPAYEKICKTANSRLTIAGCTKILCYYLKQRCIAPMIRDRALAWLSCGSTARFKDMRSKFRILCGSI